MEIQVLSDCHLECYSGFPRLRSVAPYLVLAGDIGNINKRGFNGFIDYVSKNWDKVVYVMGNHEFYSNQTHYESTLGSYRDFFAEFDNIEFLEKEETTLGGYRVLGATMWSELPPDTSVSSPKKVKKLVYKDGGPVLEKIGIDGINKLHEDSVKWLTDNYNPDIPTIVVTHYPLTVDPERIRQLRHRDEPVEKAMEFGSSLPISPRSQLVCISGHTHYGHDFTDGPYTRFISNQQGYPDETKNVTNRDSLGRYTVFQEKCTLRQRSLSCGAE